MPDHRVTVADVHAGTAFVADPDDVKALRTQLPSIARWYDAFFVHMDGGEIQGVWGVLHRQYHMDTTVYPIL